MFYQFFRVATGRIPVTYHTACALSRIPAFQYGLVLNLVFSSAPYLHRDVSVHSETGHDQNAAIRKGGLSTVPYLLYNACSRSSQLVGSPDVQEFESGK
jgi:hypothetical protein